MWKLLRIWDYFIIVSELFLPFLTLIVCAAWLESNIQSERAYFARVRGATLGHVLRNDAIPNAYSPAEVLYCADGE